MAAGEPDRLECTHLEVGEGGEELPTTSVRPVVDAGEEAREGVRRPLAVASLPPLPQDRLHLEPTGSAMLTRVESGETVADHHIAGLGIELQAHWLHEHRPRVGGQPFDEDSVLERAGWHQHRRSVPGERAEANDPHPLAVSPGECTEFFIEPVKHPIHRSRAEERAPTVEERRQRSSTPRPPFTDEHGEVAVTPIVIDEPRPVLLFKHPQRGPVVTADSDVVIPHGQRDGADPDRIVGISSLVGWRPQVSGGRTWGRVLRLPRRTTPVRISELHDASSVHGCDRLHDVCHRSLVRQAVPVGSGDGERRDRRTIEHGRDGSRRTGKDVDAVGSIHDDDIAGDLDEHGVGRKRRPGVEPVLPAVSHAPTSHPPSLGDGDWPF